MKSNALLLAQSVKIYLPLIIYLSSETISVANKMHQFFLPELNFVPKVDKISIYFHLFQLGIFIWFLFAQFFLKFYNNGDIQCMPGLS